MRYDRAEYCSRRLTPTGRRLTQTLKQNSKSDFPKENRSLIYNCKIKKPKAEAVGLPSC
jgi:hypothetical protein